MIKTNIIDIQKLRSDFPILTRKVRDNKSLVYLDNASTTQKPIQVIEAIHNYYMYYNANIHRAVYQLAEEATNAYEGARERIAKFINADREEIIFVRNATEAINLVAYAWGRKNVGKDDRVVISELEHHSNIVPWQLLTQEKNAKLEYIRIDSDGLLILDDLYNLLEKNNVKLVSISQMSNVLGTIIPVDKIVKACHIKNVPVLIDAAQSVPHIPVDVKKIDCSFMAFSAHKMLGPTGVGVLYAKKEYLEKMQPFISGGDMIKEVHKYETRWNDIPWKYEAGTPNIADVIGYGVAIDYLTNIGMDNVREYENELTRYALDRIINVKGIHVYGTRDIEKRGGLISFNLGDIHPHDLSTILDEDGIAIRSGHHCAQPLMELLDVAATSRVSFYIYNTKEEIDSLINSLERARVIFRI
ncbi:MAG: cysteine desulfurase [Thaumarchaeota archaeon]|nr:cysteine desulfurase [Nitrososphaerota archaeon]|tara:strand:- start:246 stop:1490 length:1245 start_codon:yes stop_codon:yes gene_type:complete